MQVSHHDDIFIQNYSKFTNTLNIKNLVDHLISERIIGIEEKESISVSSLLHIIGSHLKSGVNVTFCTMLDIMEKFGDLATTDLAISIKQKISISVIPIHENDPDFSTFDNVEVMFVALVSALQNMIGEEKFKMVRRGCIMNTKMSSSKFPIDFVNKIDATKTMDDLFDVVVTSPYCSWINIHLLEKMAAASNTWQLIEQYKNAVFSKKLKDIFKHFPNSQVADKYFSRKEFDDVIIKDVISEWSELERFANADEPMLLLDSNNSQQTLNSDDEANLTRAEGTDNNEECSRALQSDEQHCGICHDIACDPVVTNRCCNQIFCSRCLKEYLEHIQDNHARPCPCCTKQHFTYVPLSMKVRSIIILLLTVFCVNAVNVSQSH